MLSLKAERTRLNSKIYGLSACVKRPKPQFNSHGFSYNTTSLLDDLSTFLLVINGFDRSARF
jgi:hypothetical protein